MEVNAHAWHGDHRLSSGCTALAQCDETDAILVQPGNGNLADDSFELVGDSGSGASGFHPGCRRSGIGNSRRNPSQFAKCFE
jgi:hypothetical protein